MRCRLCLAVQPRSLTARTLGPTSCSTKRQPQWRSSSMAGIIPIHSHYHTRDAPLSPPPRQSQTEPVTAPGSKPHTRQQSHERPGTQARSTTMSGTPNQGPGLRYPSNKKSIYDRNLNRSKNAELSRAAFAYLFIEMIAYAQRGVSNVGDLEQKYVQRRNHTKTHADEQTQYTRIPNRPAVARPASLAILESSRQYTTDSHPTPPPVHRANVISTPLWAAC